MELELDLNKNNIYYAKYHIVYKSDYTGDNRTGKVFTFEELKVKGVNKIVEEWLGTIPAFEYNGFKGYRVNIKIRVAVSEKPFRSEYIGEEICKKVTEKVISPALVREDIGEIKNKYADFIRYFNYEKWNDTEEIKIIKKEDSYLLIEYKNKIQVRVHSWEDIKGINDNLEKRIVDNMVIHFYKTIENKVIYWYSEKKIYLEDMRFKEDKENKNEYGTIDIEAFVENNKFNIYAIGIYSPEKYASLYLTEYKGIKEFTYAILNTLKKRKEKIYYAHNGGKFDSILLFDLFIDLKDEDVIIQPMFHDNSIFNYN